MTRAPKSIVALALLAALPLGACTDVPNQPDLTTQASSEAAASSDPAVAASEPTDVASIPAAPSAPRTPMVPLAKFPGLSGAQVTGMLGKPQFLRQDATSELWQYRADGCVLHLFLYRDKDGLRVRHAEMRPRTMPGVAMSGPAADACLTKLTAAPPAATS